MEMGDDKAMAGTSTDPWALWQSLGRPKHVLAPMVDQSELAWRLLARRRGAHLCFTPMYHASVFARDATYRKAAMLSCSEDRPLIVQFCANDAETLVQCVDLVAGQCEAVDLNLGCPQTIARKGHYGAFLQDDWELIFNMVSSVAQRCSVPITCKVRVFPSAERTVAYAQMLQRAGAQVLTVHGRTREQKGANTGLADWKIIAMVKRAVSIPVIANGNIQTYGDVIDCLEQTGCDAVMSAEGHLHDPNIFDERRYKSPEPHYEVALSYLELVRQHVTDLAAVRAHLFKLCHHTLLLDSELRIRLGRAYTLDEVVDVVQEIRRKCTAGVLPQPAQLTLPHHLCQPYYRCSDAAGDGKSAATSDDKLNEPQANDAGQAAAKAAQFRLKVHQERCALSEETGASKRLIRKLQKRSGDARRVAERAAALLARANSPKSSYGVCECGNAAGAKCEHARCRTCCRKSGIACLAHRSGKRSRVESDTQETSRLVAS